MTLQDQRGNPMRKELIKRLQQTDTPTVCNAIELAIGKRGFNLFTRGDYFVMHNNAQVAMGFARTARIASEQPSKLGDIATKRLRMDYYRYMSEAAKPAICVIEDVDPEPVGAFWGEVNTKIHLAFGMSGALTNGTIRDFGCCPPEFQVIGGGVSPSHRFVHVQDIGNTVKVFGLLINDGDFVHADRHGACIIPVDILPNIDYWIEKLQQLEAIVIDPIKEKDFNFKRFAEAWQELEKKRV